MAPGLVASGRAAGWQSPPGDVSPKPKGGHRAGTGRLGADAYVNAERVACRYEDLAPGQRCPVCGQGSLYRSSGFLPISEAETTLENGVTS